MYFEMKDKTLVDVTRASWDGINVSISLRKGGQDQIITDGNAPHSDFKAALEKLAGIFIYHMELSGCEDLFPRIKITGVEEKTTKTGKKGFRFHAKLSCHKTETRFKLVTATLEIPGAGFFEAEDEYGNKVNPPEAYLYLLQDDEIELIKEAFHEAYLYAIENKTGAPVQPDLFDSVTADGSETATDSSDDEDSGFADMPSEFPEAGDDLGGGWIPQEGQPDEDEEEEDPYADF